MSDFALKRVDGIFDLDFDGQDLVLSDSLRESVLVSLMVNGRESYPEGVAVLQPVDGGWWANASEDVAIGSMLWTLQRRKLDDNAVDDAKAYAEKALQWMIDDKVAKSVNVSVTRNVSDVSRLDFLVVVERPDGTGEEIRFDYLWQSTV